MEDLISSLIGAEFTKLHLWIRDWINEKFAPFSRELQLSGDPGPLMIPYNQLQLYYRVWADYRKTNNPPDGLKVMRDRLKTAGILESVETFALLIHYQQFEEWRVFFALAQKLIEFDKNNPPPCLTPLDSRISPWGQMVQIYNDDVKNFLQHFPMINDKVRQSLTLIAAMGLEPWEVIRRLLLQCAWFTEFYGFLVKNTEFTDPKELWDAGPKRDLYRKYLPAFLVYYAQADEYDPEVLETVEIYLQSFLDL